MNITAAAIEALRNHREDLDRAIQVLQRMSHWEGSPLIPQEQSASAETTEPQMVESTFERTAIPGNRNQAALRLPSEEIANLRGWEACRLVLRRCGEAMTVPQIVAALEFQGFALGSKDRRAYVSTTLRRHSTVFVRLGEPPPVRWGLREWVVRVQKK